MTEQAYYLQFSGVDSSEGDDTPVRRPKSFDKWTDEEADAEFARVLAEHDASLCPSCGRQLDRGDVAWNNSGTEAGTPYSVLEIICQNCAREIVCIHSWYPEIEDFNEFVDVLERDWNKLNVC